MVKILIDQISEDIVETIRESLLVLASDLKIISANRSFYEFFKVKPEETIGHLIYDLGNKQWDIPKLRELLETILPEKTSFDNYEVEHDFATIGRRVMLLNARQIEQAMGKERIILLAIEDITARKDADVLLSISEEQYRRLFETADDGILLLEKSKLKIRHANPAIMAMLGYSNKELIGKDMKAIGFPDDIGSVNEIMETLNKDGISHWKDVGVQNKAGQSIYTDIYMTDRAILVQCNIREITERKRAIDALQESEAFKNTIIQSSPDCIKLLDLEGNLTYMSKGGQEKLEIQDIKVYLNKSWIGFWQGKDNVNARMAVDTAIKGAVGKFRGYSPTETGKPKWWDVIITPLCGSNGEVEKLLAVSRDVTEQKQMEEELLRAQKLESVGLLAGGIAHDFNNILTTILGNVSLARMKVDPEDELFDLLREAEATSKKAQTLTKQLLTFAKGGAPVKETAFIQDILKESSSFVLRGSKSSCKLSIAENLWPAEIDVGQISQVINNVVINANQAMPEGGIIQVAAVNLMIDYRPGLPLKQGKYVRISIKDQGVGIAEKHFLNIFDPYFTTKQEGSGLGLATTYSIIKKHDGHITVESKLGEGTTFHIYLPASDKAAPEKEAVKLIKGQGRILVMDDEASLEKILGRIGEPWL